MRSGLAYSRRLWLVAHSLGSVGSVWWRLCQTLGRAAERGREWQTQRAEARPPSRPLLNVGRLPLLLKRSEAADYLAEHLSRGGGTFPAVRLFSFPFKWYRLVTFFLVLLFWFSFTFLLLSFLLSFLL